MTTHAEMVEGVRELVAEMTAAMLALQERYPVSTFMAAMQARKCLEAQQYGEAADHARAVLATLRGVPAGAVEVEPFGVAVLLGLVQDIIANASTAPYLSASDEKIRTAMGSQLTQLDELLSNASAVYITPREKVDA